MRWSLWTFAIVLLLSIPIYIFWGQYSAIYNYGNFLQCIALIFATVSCYQAQYLFPRNDERRGAWGRLAFGSFIWVIAQLFEWYCEVVLKLVAYGTIADCFWGIGYVVLLMGLFQWLRVQQKDFGPSLLPQMLLLLGIYTALFYFQIWPQLQDPEERFIEKLLDVAYPTFDYAMFAFSALLLTIAWARKAQLMPALAFSAGFASLLYADFLLGATSDLDSPLYIMIDLFYFATYFLIGFAAQAEMKITDPEFARAAPVKKEGY